MITNIGMGAGVVACTKLTINRRLTSTSGQSCQPQHYHRSHPQASKTYQYILIERLAPVAFLQQYGEVLPGYAMAACQQMTPAKLIVADMLQTDGPSTTQQRRRIEMIPMSGVTLRK